MHMVVESYYLSMQEVCIDCYLMVCIHKIRRVESSAVGLRGYKRCLRHVWGGRKASMMAFQLQIAWRQIWPAGGPIVATYCDTVRGYPGTVPGIWGENRL